MSSYKSQATSIYCSLSYNSFEKRPKVAQNIAPKIKVCKVLKINKCVHREVCKIIYLSNNESISEYSSLVSNETIFFFQFGNPEVTVHKTPGPST